MTAEQVKASILQLAIQGKLVPQGPNDEPVSELLKRIEAKKGANGTKKKKNLPPIADKEKPFAIPDSWEWVRLGEICEYSLGKTPPRAGMKYWKNGVHNWVSISDMVADGYVCQTKEKVTDLASEELFGGRVSKSGTLLMSFKLTVGRTSILSVDAYHNEAIVSLIPIVDEGCIMQQFLFRLLPVLSKLGKSKSAIKGATLNSKSIGELPIPLPPLAEQKRIVEKVEALFKYVDECEDSRKELAENLSEALKRSILQEAIQGKLVPQDPNDEPASELLKRIEAARNAKSSKKKKPLPPITDDEKPFAIPDSWEWVRLEDIADMLGTKSYQILESAIKQQGEFPVVSQSQRLIDGYCDDKNKVLRDVPIIVFGDHTRNVKYVDFPFVVGADGTKLFKVYVYAKWAYYWTLYAATILIGSRGYGRHWKIFSSLPIPLPPLAEQKRIVEKVEALLAAVGRIKEGAAA